MQCDEVERKKKGWRWKRRKKKLITRIGEDHCKSLSIDMISYLISNTWSYGICCSAAKRIGEKSEWNETTRSLKASTSKGNVLALSRNVSSFHPIKECIFCVLTSWRLFLLNEQSIVLPAVFVLLDSVVDRMLFLWLFCLLLFFFLCLFCLLLFGNHWWWYYFCNSYCHVSRVWHEVHILSQRKTTRKSTLTNV